MNGETPMDGPELKRPEPTVSGRGGRVISRALLVLGVVAVGGFGYLLGVRLSGAGGGQGAGQAQASRGGAGGGQGSRGGAAGQGASAGSALPSGNTQAGNTQGRAGGSGRGGAGRGGAASVQTVAAKSGVLSAQHQSAATVVPLLQSNVAAQVAGTVQQILQPVGSAVGQGEAVIRLSSDTLQAAIVSAQNSLQQAQVNLATQTNANTDQRNQLTLQVSSARAALASAQQTYAADQKLYAIGGVPQTELSTARSAVDTARANLASAQNALATNGRAKTETLAGLQLSVKQAQNSLAQAQQNAANATVRAPFAGQISAIPVSQGENLSSGAAAFTLTSAGRKVTFNVAPTDAAALHAGQVLPFKVNQQTYQVKLDQNPAAPMNSVVTVSARLLGSPLPGTGAVGSVSYATPVASGILVPSSALQADSTQSYVFVAENGQAKRQNVTLLGQAGEQSAVGGLPAGSPVIVSPPSGLLDGASVIVANGNQGAGAQGAGAAGTGTNGAGTGYRRRGGAAGSSGGGSQGSQSQGSQSQGGSAPAAKTGTGGQP